MQWLRRLAFVLAVSFLIMTFVNASWLAPVPTGYARLLAVRGISQQPAAIPARGDDCTARQIEPPVHEFIENTALSIQRASAMGAEMVSVDVNSSADGTIVLLRDSTLDCRTNGRGPVSAMTAARLRTLDAGYGYSADGGASFPLRGRGVGHIPTLDDALQALPREPLLFKLAGRDPVLAGKLGDALLASGRDVIRLGDGFLGDDAAMATIRRRFPGVWAFSPTAARRCSAVYQWQGWLGLTPASCRQGTMLIPIDQQWLFAGWPNRLIARMAAVDAHVIVTGPAGDDPEPRGLDLPEQIGQVPASFNGHIWVADLWVIGPALHPAGDRRNGREKEETDALIARRRDNR